MFAEYAGICLGTLDNLSLVLHGTEPLHACRVDKQIQELD